MPWIYKRLMMNNKQLFAEIIAQKIDGFTRYGFSSKMLSQNPNKRARP
jgi:hypothetical protein